MGMKEMGDFIKRCEEEGELLRIKKEVDWHLELGHVAKLSEERQGPALLFENVKGHDIPVLTSAFTTTRRFAIALDMPLESSICDMARQLDATHYQKTGQGENCGLRSGL